MNFVNHIISQMSKESFLIITTVSYCLLGLTGHVLLKFILSKLHKKSKLTKNNWDNALIEALKIPAVILIWFTALISVVSLPEIKNHVGLFKRLHDLSGAMYSALLGWFFLRFISKYETLLLKIQHGIKADPSTIIAISKLIRIIIILVFALNIMQDFGFSISGLLAFGGIGGIAIGFAAKDMLVNFFGGLMVFLDNPFKVGDEIRTPGHPLSGFVEYIGWRQTRIRTYDRNPVHIPNSSFMTMPVENLSRRQNRRIKTTINLRYKDSDKLGALLEELRNMLNEHPDLDHSRATLIYFNNFGDFSLDCLLYCFTKTKVWAQYLATQEKLFLDIINIVHKHDADFAFPTTTLDIEKQSLTHDTQLKSQ